MTPIAWIMAAVWLVAPLVARAQGVPTDDACRAWLARLPAIPFDGTPTAAVGDGPDACRYEGVAVKMNAHAAMRADTLLVRGISLDPAAAAGPPMTLRAEARGVHQVFHVGSPAADYMLSQQQMGNPLNLTLEITRDPVARTWVLHELTVEGERFGRVSVDGEVDGVGPIRSLDAPPPGFEAVAIGRLHAMVGSPTVVPFYVLPLVVDRLPQADTVAAVDSAVRTEAAVVAEQARRLLPLAGASPSTIDAMVRLIGDFPHPVHPLDLTVAATPPLRLDEIDTASRALDGVETLMKRVTVTATYAGPFGR